MDMKNKIRNIIISTTSSIKKHKNCYTTMGTFGYILRRQINYMNDKMYYDKMKEIEKFLKSDENKLFCKPYILDCERITKIANEYNGKNDLLFEQLDQNITNIKYASGGEGLHRGFYCPSPVLDIVVGGIKRGKLLIQLRKNSKPSYKYGFDDKNNLITVEYLHFKYFYKEIVITNNNHEIGIAFTKNSHVETISECIYENNRIVSYIFCIYDSYDNIISEYTKEVYEYSKEGLEKVDMFLFMNNKNAPFLNHDQFVFTHDNEGYLSSYIVKEFKNAKEILNPYTNHKYDVYIKRKV